LIVALKDDPKAQKALFVRIVNAVPICLIQLGPKILAIEKLSRGFEAA
jgi:hypothetical protein